MNLLLWKVTLVACFAKVAFCLFLESSPENIDAVQTLKDKEYPELCPSTNPRISVYLPHPEDCSQFYICENKIPYPKKCPKGLHFNIKLKACDYPETAGCDKNAEEKVKGRIGKEKFETCPQKNFKFPVYLPDPEDCTRFFICDNGVPHSKKCFPGLHFNPKINACDYPKNAQCDTNAEEEKKGRIDEDNFDICPKKNSKFPVYLPDPEDCTRFFICDSGVPHSKKCFPGLHFNPKINACDYPRNAKCDTNADDNAKGRITVNEAGECPKENSIVPVHLPHPDDCNKFYICDNGSPILKSCLPGLHFNPKLNACDFRANAGCDKDKPKGKARDNSLGICQNEDSTTPVYFPHPEDCNKFYMCIEGSAFTKKCPVNLHFNPKLNVCDYPGNAGCDTDQLKSQTRDNSLGICQNEDSTTPEYFPHPDDCNKFYICLNGSAFTVKCPASLHFNPKENFCDFPENVACDIGDSRILRGIPFDAANFFSCPDDDIPTRHPHPIYCDKFYECDHGIAILRSCDPGVNFNEEIQACDQAENTICETGMTLASVGFRSPYCPSVDGKLPIFYRHPTNCSVYYMCGNGYAYEFVCPARLHFNLRRRLCDYEEYAKCKT